MTDFTLRPRADSLLRAWGQMIQTESNGPGFDFIHPRQSVFKKHADRFCANPRPASFDGIWTPEATVEHSNPGGALLRSAFDGDIDDLAEFLETLRTSTEYNRNWEELLGWKLALWELYTRLNESVPITVTSETTEALSWFGAPISGGFRERRQNIEQFRSHYESVVGHPTQGTSHEVPVKTELDQLFHAIQTLDSDEIGPQLKGPHSDFYQLLYGGGEVHGGRGPVQLTGVVPIIRAFAWAKANSAYDKPSKPAFWGGTYWENWKESYANHVRTEIREQFTLDDISTEEIGPFFEALTNAEASDLGKPVATYVMGSQWGQYAWNDVVDHFSENATEASRVLSLFFDDSVSVMPRLEAFKEHTIHLTETEGRSPGSIERMATSLLMFTYPEKHLGLPSSRTRQFLEANATLPKYKSGFRPRQYQRIIGPLRGLRDDVRLMMDERNLDIDITMLDIHSMIWIFGGEGAPTSDDLPSEDW